MGLFILITDMNYGFDMLIYLFIFSFLVESHPPILFFSV